MPSVDEFFTNRSNLTEQQKQSLPHNDGMNLELLRLGTFKTWPTWAPIYAHRLSRAGFFFKKTADEVECYSCAGTIRQWHTGDRPMDRHRLLSPNCEFVLGTSTTNVPLPRPDPLVEPVASNDANEATTIHDGPSDEDPAPIQSSSSSSSSSILSNSSGYLNSAPANLGPGIVPLSVLLPDYQQQQARLDTFRSWPSNSYVGPEELAQAGFVYLGSGDRVQCAFCKGVLRNWAPGDRAFVEHQRHFPQCPFVRNPDAASTAMGGSRGTRTTTTASALGFPGVQSLQDLGIETNLPKHHNYALEESRLATYTEWPKNTTQTPEALAKAGFFYIGQADSVKCFWCDGGLRNWENGDDPFEEHARWFPKCGHIKRTKGAAFIEEVKRKNSTSNAGSTSVGGSSAPIFREIDEREVVARMDTTIVKTILDMGFSKAFVRQVIDYRLRTQGDDFPSAEVLLDTVMQYQNSPPENFPPPVRTPATSTAPTTTSSTTTSATSSASSSTASSTPVSSEGNGNGSKKGKKRKNGKKKGNGTNEGGTEKMEVEEPSNNEDRSASLPLSDKAPECKICMDAEVNIVFLPCGHLVCCSRCAPALKNCPICRGLIKGTVNVYMS